jgi:recombination protein RecR
MLPKSIEKLINEFSKLPGIGPKSAARLTFYLLHRSEEEIGSLGSAISHLKEHLIYCSLCHNIAETDPCDICDNQSRDPHTILVVEDPLDVIAFERTREYRGTYHVLHGLIMPIDGIGPEQLKIKELIERARKLTANGKEIEIILGTNPSMEGEATATYIHQQLEEFPNITITRIARGLPVGGDLEYADDVTLTQALEGRRKY